MNGHHLRLVPVRVADVADSELLQTIALRRIGWRSLCDCGWRSKVATTRGAAVVLGRNHVIR